MHIQHWKYNSRKTTVFPHVKQEKCEENNIFFPQNIENLLKNICAITREGEEHRRNFMIAVGQW